MIPIKMYLTIIIVLITEKIKKLQIFIDYNYNVKPLSRITITRCSNRSLFLELSGGALKLKAQISCRKFRLIVYNMKINNRNNLVHYLETMFRVIDSRHYITMDISPLTQVFKYINYLCSYKLKNKLISVLNPTF